MQSVDNNSQDTLAFSVIVPTCGRVALFHETLASLAAQSCRNFEVVVPDDSSEEQDRHEIEKAVNRFSEATGVRSTYVFSKPRLYQAANTNQGFAKASGRYIRILHSDDLLREDGVASELAALKSFGYPEVLFQDVVPFIDRFHSAQSPSCTLVSPLHFLRTHLSTGTALPSGMAFSRSLLAEVGRMQEDYRFLCDWDLFMRLLINQIDKRQYVLRLSAALVGWRVHPNSVTRILWYTHFLEHRRLMKWAEGVFLSERRGLLSRKDARDFLRSGAAYRYVRLLCDYRALSPWRRILSSPKVLTSCLRPAAIPYVVPAIARKVAQTVRDLTRRGRGGELPSPPQAWREAAAPSFGVLPFSDIGLQVHHGTAVVSDYDNLFNLWRVRDQVQSAREVWLYYPNVNRFYHRSIKEVLKYIPLNQVVHLVLTCNQHLTWFGAKAVVEELFPLEFELIGQTRDANGQWVLSYRRGKAVAAHNAERHTGWTFGLLTLGKKRDEVLKYIDSIERACPDSYEIVIVCPHELTWLGDRSNLRVIRFSEKDDLGWITRKKNLICEEATFSDILICHDRFTVAHDFFTAFERWGYSYGIAAPRVCFENGARALDWAIVSSENRVWSTGGLLDYRAYSRYAYVPGGATLVRKSFAQRYPWSETLFWNEHEDVELCRRAQRSGEIIYLADSTVITSNDRWLQENPEIPYDDQTEQVLGGPVGEQRVHFGQHCQCG